MTDAAVWPETAESGGVLVALSETERLALWEGLFGGLAPPSVCLCFEAFGRVEAREEDGGVFRCVDCDLPLAGAVAGQMVEG